MYDVIVVGAGPVGTHTASRLAAFGHRVAVLERRRHLGQKPCTGIVSVECVRSFGIDESLILRRVSSARLFSPSGDVIRLWRQSAQACVVDRAAFETYLLKRAQDSGCDYCPQTLATDVKVDDDCVRVEAVRGGSKTTFEAKAVVISTGFGSKISGGLGLRRAGDFVIGAQAQVESHAEEVEVYFGKKVAPGFFGWLVPTSTGKALVGLMTRWEPQVYIKKLLLSLAHLGKIVSPDVEAGYAGIPLKPLSRTYAKRLLVVGDAAGQVKPTTCGGIYYGLLCADIAARTLRRALQNGDFSAKALATYERDWRRRLGREFEIDYYARQFYERLGDERIDRLFDLIKTRGIHEALLKSEALSFDWHSAAILRLMKHRVISHTLQLMKVPFRLGSESWHNTI